MTLELDRPSAAPIPPAPRRRRARRSGVPSGVRLGSLSGVSLGVVTLWLTLLVLLPLAAVVGKAFGAGWSGFYNVVTAPEAYAAITLTVKLSVGVAVVNAVMGTLVSWVLVRERFRGAGIVDFVIDIPFALPTIVTGVVMIALYGADSPVNISLQGKQTGLFVALLFVTLPFTVRTVQPVLHQLDRDAEQAAASLGASGPVIFRRIVLPQIAPAVASGAALSFARALGEYGSLVLISSNLPFKTEIASSFIYAQTQNSDNPAAADRAGAAVATVLLFASAVVLVFLDVVQRRVSRRG